MCNRYRVTAKQIEIARQFGFDIGRLMPEPDALPPPELFRSAGWVVRKENGEKRLDVMQWGVPLNGKPVTNVRNLQSPFWRSMLKDPARRCLVPVTHFWVVGQFEIPFVIVGIDSSTIMGTTATAMITQIVLR